MSDESSYWWGVRDAARFELDELNRIDAPKRVRAHALAVFLAVSEVGAQNIRERVGAVNRSSSSAGSSRRPRRARERRLAAARAP